jgi:hypothetical protein
MLLIFRNLSRQGKLNLYHQNIVLFEVFAFENIMAYFLLGIVQILSSKKITNII